MREPELRELGVAGFRRRVAALLEVYVAAMDPPPDQLPGRHAIMQRHATYPGFRALVAEAPRRFGRSRQAAGFLYGFHGMRGQWWHDVVEDALAGRVGREAAATWLSDTFEVAELHVRPEFQGRGIGRRLLTRACADRPERTVVLSTLDNPGSRARHLYTSEGMTDLLEHFEFPGGGPLYCVMGAALPLGTRAAGGPANASAPSRP